MLYTQNNFEKEKKIQLGGPKNQMEGMKYPLAAPEFKPDSTQYEAVTGQAASLPNLGQAPGQQYSDAQSALAQWQQNKPQAYQNQLAGMQHQPMEQMPQLMDPGYATVKGQTASASASDTGWTPGQYYLDAQEALAQWQQNQPGAYQSAYNDTINGMLDKILNREAFSYVMNADPLYQQYKDNYTRQGQMAARDVTGQMSAMTGGYGNSYAATAGNQAYQNSLAQLNNIVPELYSQAANQYYQQGQQMLSNLSALQGQENSAFNQYQAGMNNYYTGLNSAMEMANNAYAQDYGQHQDALTQQNWQAEQDFNAAQADQTQSNWQSQFNADHSKPNKFGYTGGQEAMARERLRQSPEAAIQYINQLNLRKSARDALLRALGLYGYTG